MLEITGADDGEEDDGCDAADDALGAGSRTVERRRGGAGSAAACGGGGGVSSGGAETGSGAGSDSKFVSWKGGAIAEASSSLTGGKSVPGWASRS